MTQVCPMTKVITLSNFPFDFDKIFFFFFSKFLEIFNNNQVIENKSGYAYEHDLFL